jgi:2-polyprenyl-6-methoxyphenol hydroxylase-like FAD-dependent oxidoreductase
LKQPISDLRQPITALSKPIHELNVPIDHLQRSMNSLPKPIESLAEPLGQLRKPLDGIAAPLNNLEPSVRNLAPPVTELSGSVDTLQTQVASLAGEMKELRQEAELHYGLTSACAWRSITPISRASARHVAREGVFLCGDAARVVEPFTGEGISYALRSGALLANILNSGKSDSTMVQASQEELYRRGHRDLYRSGLLVNRLTCLLSEHPRIAHALSPFLLKHPRLLSFLTSKVISI